MPSRVIRGVSDIPTISRLYATNRLSPPPTTTTPLRTPSASLNSRISLLRADITTLPVDAIVNAAKNSLRGGGGVDGAIHSAAGRGLVHECLTKYPGGCKTGDAVVTGGHGLPAKHVIHTVGPVYQNRTVSEPLLLSCYQTCLDAAVDTECATVAFSGISTGVYGYPSEAAAHVACRAVRDFLQGDHDEDSRFERVIFVTFLDKDVKAYDAVLPLYFPPDEGELPQSSTD
ncbi:uncharacterized protein Triagg1_7863 [Trichoderma aggressivum f. europaeum]|uniref:Macro domain-containing protein n=1 Tax=Trichoderma aggressivum f. europaeum TaxID=173218 RepID=A0AAE1J520_9HYPO|nr:hypothetical protein Triagg1_7863 [Trichoderma aggressivum f. europaeum]